MKIKLLSIVTFATLFFSGINFAQAPLLGTAANFVLYTSTGAVTNTGVSHITGNVGTNSGSATGFGNVNGVMHENDGATTQCAADLLIAYGQLNTATPTFHPAALLGNGDTLIAGVYHIAAASTLGGDLYLDAKGNASAVFIFQIEAAFSVNAFSKIKLIIGALACNVFWKVEGLVSIATATFMRGTIIANNAAIDMSVNDTLEGRALSTAGAISLNGVLAYTPIGCGSPVLTGPAAPTLASTANYALFSGNGEVTNSGITYLTGDVGTNVGLTTGFDSLYVTGNIHPIPDGSTAACAADLLNVYTYLNTLPYDIELLYPAQFGNDLVLTPHTYRMSAATTFTGNIFLNALGDSNAVFVIQINGALITSTYSKVILINGTKAKNVYWKVEGAVDINDYSVFNGTLICNNGAISLYTGDTINGRALTTNGAVKTAAIVINMTDTSSFTLGVNWLYFRGKSIQKNVLLEWSIALENNNGYFTIEKSSDGKIFESLAVVDASSGFGNTEKYFAFTDQNPFSTNYYRISQTGNDGQKIYFKTIQVKVNIRPELNVFHFVMGNKIYIQISNALPGKGSIDLYRVDGKKISSQQVLLTNEVSKFKIDKPQQKGIYILHFISNGQLLYNAKVAVF